MKPNKRIDSQSVGELIQRLGARKITPTRFSVELAPEQLLNALCAAYAAELKIRRREPILDDDTLGHIREAAKWLGDPKAPVGFMMTGLYGNGKTTLMTAMCNLVNWLYDSPISTERAEIRTVNARDVAEMAVEERTRDSYKKLCHEEMLAIDEVGEEPPEIIRYGRVYTPIRDLLEKRYALQKLTIIATNLVENAKAGKKQLTEHYGARVVDRFREMMKIVPFHNPSYRQQRHD